MTSCEPRLLTSSIAPNASGKEAIPFVQESVRNCYGALGKCYLAYWPPNPQLRRSALRVLDNLSTHSPGALYEAFPAPEAHRVLRRLEFHYTPKHAPWLNMVEIGVLRSQCLDRRMGDRKTLDAEIAAWQDQRNAQADAIKWMFTTQHARSKLLRAYPDPDKES